MRDRKAKKGSQPPAVLDDGASPYVPKFESEWDQTKFRPSLWVDLLAFMDMTDPDGLPMASEPEHLRNPTPFFPGFLEAYRQANPD
jgi:hypothetical protein